MSMLNVFCLEWNCQAVDKNFSILQSHQFVSLIRFCILFPTVFNPIHLVVRQTNEIDTTLTVDRPNLGATLEHALERTQMSNIPIDMPHLSECSHGCFLSNDETILLPSGASAASLKNIGVQCDLVDVDAMLAEFRRIHPHDVDMPLFVSAMNMAREDTGNLHCKKKK